MEQLKLSNQVCFPVYTLAKEIVNKYRPLLDELEITYPQYLVLIVLWEEDGLTVSKIGERLKLDSGTLTPLLKRLEQKEILRRERSSQDERVVHIYLMPQGQALYERALEIPNRLISEMNTSIGELRELKGIIDNILNNLK